MALVSRSFLAWEATTPSFGPNIINSEIYGGDGNDDIDLGSPGSGFVDGGAGNDIINGSNSADALYGSSGDDMIDSVVGDDFVDGGDGNDTIILGNGGVAVGGTGNDTIVAGTFSSTTISARLFGGAGNDTIDARGGGSDDLFGEDGDDLFLTGGNERNRALLWWCRQRHGLVCGRRRGCRQPGYRSRERGGNGRPVQPGREPCRRLCERHPRRRRQCQHFHRRRLQ